jgi:preprotein translocase SecE subunit
MARDRQRAKQRRRRRPAAGGPPPGAARTRARDNAPPEPTEHAFPDVEQAELAEAGVPELEEETERAPDEAESVPGYAADPAVAEERAEAARPRRKRGRIFTFLGHVVDELRRVQWPDRRQTGQGTAVVLGFVVLAGGYLGLMDAIWQPIVEAIL